MEKATLHKAGLAAVILLAPGGFIFGATLAARYWQRRRAEKTDDPLVEAQVETAPETDAE